MKTLKKILAGIVILIAILLIAALFISKEYSIEREVTINKPKEEVFTYVKNIKNQGQYNKWVMMDPNARRSFRGTDGTVGFVDAWDSDKSDVGKGEQEIKNIAEGKRLDIEVRFEKPFKNTATVFLTTDQVAPDKTKVKWGMAGKNPYPVNLMNLFIPSMLGKDMQTSLNNLKGVLENSSDKTIN